MDSVSDGALRCGAELVVHAYPDGAAPGAPRAARRWASPYQVVRRPGISEDVAMLLAYEKGAELIVAVGTHFNLIEFLERNRAGHVVDVPDAAAGGGDPRRREGRLPTAVPPRRLGPLVLSPSRGWRRSSSRSSRRRPSGT